MQEQNNQITYPRYAKWVVILSFVILISVISVAIWSSFSVFFDGRDRGKIWQDHGESNSIHYFRHESPAEKTASLEIDTSMHPDQQMIELSKIYAMYLLKYELDYASAFSAFPESMTKNYLKTKGIDIEKDIKSIDEDAATKLGFNYIDISLKPSNYLKSQPRIEFYNTYASEFIAAGITRDDIQDIKTISFYSHKLAFQSSFFTTSNTVWVEFFKYKNKWYLSPEYLKESNIETIVEKNNNPTETTVYGSITKIKDAYIHIRTINSYTYCFVPGDMKHEVGQNVTLIVYDSYIGGFSSGSNSFELFRVKEILP